MNILLIGAGAIGNWIGANLLRAGNNVTFVGRQPYVDAVTHDGLRVALSNAGEWHIASINAMTNIADATRDASYDFAAICVKAYALDEVIAELAPSQNDIRRFVCFQNGVGSEEKLAETFGSNRVIAATLTSPIRMIAPNKIALDKRGGGIAAAPVGDNAEATRAFVASSHTEWMPSYFIDSYRAMKWSKMLLNIVGNASSAITEKNVGEIYDDPKLFAVEMRMLRECLEVMRKLDIPVIDLPRFPARTFGRLIRFLPNPILQPLLKKRITKGRGDKMPSFYYDAKNKIGKCEVIYLNGKIAEHGAQLGVPTPINTRMTEMLMSIVNGTDAQTPDKRYRSLISR
jgi:2-dehydropantoate 2-reductase